MPSAWDTAAKPSPWDSAPATPASSAPAKSAWDTAAATPLPSDPGPTSGDAGRYRTELTAEAQREGVDPAFAARIVTQESGFNPRARSPVGAEGLGQLMPDTARSLGVADPYNPEQNIRGTVRYLRQLSDRFHGDERLIAAGYNAGPGAVEKYHGVPPYAETEAYVRATAAPSSAWDRAATPPPTIAPPVPNPEKAPVSKPVQAKGWGVLDMNAPNPRVYNQPGSKPGMAKRGFLEEFGGTVDAPFILMGAVQRADTPQARKAEMKKAMDLFNRDPAAANEEYGFMARKQLEAARKSNDKATRDFANYFIAHPTQAAIGAFGAEFFNPAGDATGAVVGKGAGLLGKAIKSTPQGARALSFVENLGSPLKSIAMEWGDNAKRLLLNVRSMVGKRAGDAAEIAHEVTNGVPVAERHDIMRRAENIDHRANNRPEVPLHHPNRPDLDHKAQVYHAFVKKVTAEQQQHPGLLEPERTFERGFYHPMVQAYKDPALNERDSDVLSELTGGQATGGGFNVRKGTAGVNGGHKVNVGIDDILAKDTASRKLMQTDPDHVGGQLRDDFHLGSQIQRYGARRGINIEFEKMVKEADKIGMTANRRYTYKGVVYGVGKAGHDAALKAARKAAQVAAERQAAADLNIPYSATLKRQMRQRSTGALAARKVAADKAARTAATGVSRATNVVTRTEARGREVLEQQLRGQQRLVDAAKLRATQAQQDLAAGATAARAKTLATSLEHLEKHSATLDQLQGRVRQAAARIAQTSKGTGDVMRTSGLHAAADRLADVALQDVKDPIARNKLRTVFNRIKGIEDGATAAADKVGDRIPVARLQRELKAAMGAVSVAGIDRTGPRVGKALDELHGMMQASIDRGQAGLDRNVGKVIGPAQAAERAALGASGRADQAAVDAGDRLQQTRMTNTQARAFDARVRELLHDRPDPNGPGSIPGMMSNAVSGMLSESRAHLGGYLPADRALSSIGSPSLKYKIVHPTFASFLGDPSKPARVKRAAELLGGETLLKANPGLRSGAARVWDGFHNFTRNLLMTNPAIHPLGNVATNKSAGLNEGPIEKIFTYGNTLLDVARSTVPGLDKVIGKNVDAIRNHFWGGADAYAQILEEARSAGATAEFGAGGAALGGDVARIRNTPFSELKPHEWADKVLTRMQDWNQKATFGPLGEERRAVEMFQKFRTRLGMTDQEAAFATREALGNYNNVKPGNAASMFIMFYPWLKSNSAFWMRALLKAPRQVVAMEESARRQNELAGDPKVDDPHSPEKDFTVYDPKTGQRKPLFGFKTSMDILPDVLGVVDPRGQGQGGPTLDERVGAVEKIIQNRFYPEFGTTAALAENHANKVAEDPALPWNYNVPYDKDATQGTQRKQMAEFLLNKYVPAPLDGSEVSQFMRTGHFPGDVKSAAINAAGGQVSAAQLDSSVTRSLFKVRAQQEKMIRAADMLPNAAQKDKLQRYAEFYYTSLRDHLIYGTPLPKPYPTYKEFK